MTWRYAAVKNRKVWGVKEVYEGTPENPGLGYTVDFMTPYGETLEELTQDLEWMLKDVKRGPHYEEIDGKLIEWKEETN